MDHFFLLNLLIILIFTSLTCAQQNYSANSALDCKTSDETGPSSAFLYTCNGLNTTCEAFLIFKSQLSYDSVPTISALMSTNQEEVAKINHITSLDEFPHNKEVIVPVSCSCVGQYYQSNSKFRVTSQYPTYYTVATRVYEGLSTCASIVRANSYGELGLELGMELQVPLRCACPAPSQGRIGMKYLLTYPISNNDNIADIAERFNVSETSLIQANGLEESSVLFPDTTILIPLINKPNSSQTIIHKDPQEDSPPPASGPVYRRSKRKLYEKTAIAAACSLLVLSIAVAVLFLLRRKRSDKVPDINCRKKQVLPENLRAEIASFEQVLKVFQFRDINKATQNFSSRHRIKGSVYWGELGGEIIATKKMSGDVSEEVNILKRINHFNLIKLHGVCENLGCFYLILEYMKNGSLGEWLSEKGNADIRNWSKKIQIAIDVANGLYYLHSFTEPACVHKNITSSNILLDDNLRAKIANFSLARAAETASEHVKGTGDDMAPDVYAFGFILLELITEKDAVAMHDGTGKQISAEAGSSMDKDKMEAELALIMDSNLTTSHEKKLAEVSLACLTQVPASRPSMREVVSTLVKIQTDFENSKSLNIDSIDIVVR